MIGVVAVKIGSLLFFVVIGLSANGQSANNGSGAAQQDNQAGRANDYTPPAPYYASLAEMPDDLRQEIDWDSVAESKIPADPVFTISSLQWLSPSIARPIG
jgi:hypothetical protein